MIYKYAGGIINESEDLLFTGLHQLYEICKKNVSVSLTESLHLIRHLPCVVMNNKTYTSAVKMFVIAYWTTEFLK